MWRHKLFYLPALFCVFWLHAGCSSDIDDQLFLSEQSPDGTYIVTAFHRDVHATAPISTIVSIRDASDSLDLDQNERILALRGKFEIEISWSENQTLLVYINYRPEKKDIFQKQESWNGIAIQYYHRNGIFTGLHQLNY